MIVESETMLAAASGGPALSR